MPKTAKSQRIPVFGNKDVASSMKVNGNDINPVVINPWSNTTDVYVVEIVFKNPLTTCSKLFSNSKGVTIDLSDLDTSQCTTFNMMFASCSGFTHIKVGDKFLTSSSKDFSSMFYSLGVANCHHNVDFSKFDTSLATSMKQMFDSSCFKILDLKSFDTSKVENMEKMFNNAKALSIDLSTFDTSNVINFNNMFSNMLNIISLDISKFDYSSLQTCTQFFYSMGGYLKFCPKEGETNELVQKQITEATKVAECNDVCFKNAEQNLNNKFAGGECVLSCKDTAYFKYDYNSECLQECPEGTAEIPEGSLICIDVLNCKNKYYNADMTECIDKVPDGFYCNDEDKKTIKQCPELCKTCELGSVQANLCLSCNNDKSYYDAKDYSGNTDKYLACFNSAPEGYYFDTNQYKKCYESCKTCNELGDKSIHKCTSCKDGLIPELESNCYEKCPSNQYYYFDDSNEYQCADDCPPGYNYIYPIMKCAKDCSKEKKYFYLYEGECMENCPSGYHAPDGDGICVLALYCEKYYNYEYTDCLEEIPEGFYCNDTVARTIDKCNKICKACSTESVMNDLCTKCNDSEGYYKKEDDSINTDDQVKCYNVLPERYFLDKDNNMYRKCYKTCKYCSSLGTHPEHFCTECLDHHTLNGTSNCYEICSYYYYFDSNMEYHCTTEAQCPPDKNKLIVEKNECVGACVGDFRFEFEDKCYRECPPGSFYNYEQTNCIDAVPIGYYQNDTQTIDKCFTKCKECILESVIEDHCISCANSLSYYQKEEEALANIYFDCYTGDQDGYYFDPGNNEYKQCHKTCKSCEEKGDIKNNKCTGCFSNSTLNGTNCFEICKYYHYFDDPGEYHCTGDDTCPSSRSKLIVATYECVEECTGIYIFEFNNSCYTACPPGTYYNFTQTGCIDTIPSGYYLNDTEKRTIDKCDNKCEKECILDLPTNNIICESCNNDDNYFKKEDGEVKNGYYDCFTGVIETYYLDNIVDKEYKKCFRDCKFCSESGNNLEQKCTACPDKYTLNGTNCYEICDYFYYFDDEGVYNCTENQQCPEVAPNKVVERKACVQDCIDEEVYKLVYNNICYEKCPIYYNYEQTGCIGEIPEGFYVNDSEARTIDKCFEKCKTCNKESVSKDLCIDCYNEKNFFEKENDDKNFGSYVNCYTSEVEGYYLDQNEKMYYKCFEKCKKCNGKGIITDHKCTECFPDFTLNETNCYEICPYYYYFDSEGIYHCTEEQKCPFKYSLIPEKRKCIDNCTNDDIYKYLHNGICLDAPYVINCNITSMYIDKETGDCVEECLVEDFLFNRCGLRYSNPSNQDEVISMIRDSIENGTLTGYINEILEGNSSSSFLIMEDSITYHLTTLKENNLIKKSITNVSSINLGDCENKLRDKYKIDSNLDLVIFKIDYYSNYSLIPIVNYEIFHPITLKRLNLSICENNNLNLNIPTEPINESLLYIYDPDSSYYNDECNSSTTENGYDIILTDRQQYFIENNLSICENNCILKEYDSENRQSICACNIKSVFLTSSKVHNKSDLFLSEFKTSKGSESTNALKCASTLFSKDGIINNIAFYIYLVLFIALLTCCIQFYRKGYDSLKGHINQILIIKEKKTEEEIPKLDNYDDYSDKMDQKTLEKILRLRTPKNTRHDFKGVISKDDINYQDNYSSNQKSINKLEIYNFQGNDINYNYNLKTEKEEVYTDCQINEFTYKQAIGVDVRTFGQIYISFIKYYHPLIFPCNKMKDYNSIYIKLSLIFISFSLHYLVNSLFIFKSTLHEIYETRNSNDIGKFIPYIFASFIICYVIDKLIRYVSLSGKDIYSIYNESLYNNAKIKASKVKKLLPIKYISFYILGIFSILLFGYYLATFGAVYQNTQYILIKNVLISYVISLVFPFIFIVLPSVFRRYALKDATRQWMFNLSRILQYI